LLCCKRRREGAAKICSEGKLGAVWGAIEWVWVAGQLLAAHKRAPALVVGFVSKLREKHKSERPEIWRAR